MDSQDLVQTLLATKVVIICSSSRFLKIVRTWAIISNSSNLSNTIIEIIAIIISSSTSIWAYHPTQIIRSRTSKLETHLSKQIVEHITTTLRRSYSKPSEWAKSQKRSSISTYSHQLIIICHMSCSKVMNLARNLHYWDRHWRCNIQF